MVESGGGPRPVPRGGARAALLQAASELMYGATLDDLTAFITVPRLRERTGLSSGAIYAAFAAEIAASPGRSAPQVVARLAFLDPPGDQDRSVIETSLLVSQIVEDAVDGPVALPEVIARLVAAPGVEGARGSFTAEFTHDWLAASVCLQDPEVAEDLRANYEEFRATYTPTLLRVLELVDREPVAGLHPEQVADILISVMDGLALRLRFDESLGEEFVVIVLLGLWDGLTRPVGDDDELLGIAAPRSRPLDARELQLVTDAVVDLTDGSGWGAVSVGAVAERTRLPPSQLVAHFPDRHRFAALVWPGLLESLRRRHPDPATPTQHAAAVRSLADTCCSRRALTASLLRARLAATDGLDAEHGPAALVVDDLVAWLAGPSAEGAEDRGGATWRDVVEVVLAAAATDPDVTSEVVARRALAWVAPAEQ
jgi:hypothetical protein